MKSESTASNIDNPPNAPRVTFFLMCYNQESFVEHAAQSILDQDCEPLEIIFSDDCSTDATYELLKSIARSYEGRHRVIVRQNEHNLGIGAHLNAIIAQASGELLIAAAGDDISFPHRATRIIKAWDDHKNRIDLISSHCQRMSRDGSLGEVIKTDRLDHQTPEGWLTSRPYVIGATHAFTRRLHSHFGDFIEGVVNEDQVCVFRSLCLGGAHTVDEVLVKYRDDGISKKPKSLEIDQEKVWKIKIWKLEIAEKRQIIQDSLTSGKTALNVERLKIEILDRIFQIRLSQESTRLGILKAISEHPDVPLTIRWKRSRQYLFPGVTHLQLMLRRISRLLRGKKI